MPMNYDQYLRANRLPRTAASALAWFKSGQAPAGTVIPASMRQFFGGQARIGPSTPGVDQPLAPGTPIPANVAPATLGITNLPAYTEPAGPVKPVIPTDVGRETAINQILTHIRSLPGLYNPQQMGLAANTAADLVNSGYFDTIGAEQAVSPIDTSIPAEQRPTAPDVTYHLVAGPDGRLYRQAYANISGSAAGHGAYFGSQTQANLANAQTALNAARDAIIRNFGTQSSALTRQEGTEFQGLQTDLTGARSGYADWQAQQPVPTPAAPATPAQPVVPGTPALQVPQLKTPSIPRPPNITHLMGSGVGFSAPALPKLAPIVQTTRRRGTTTRLFI